MSVRFFSQFLVLFIVHQVSVSMFSIIASIFRNPSTAAPCALLTLIVAYLFSGFVIPKCKDFYDFRSESSIPLRPQKKKIYIYIYITKMHFMTAASLPACLKWGFWISPLAYAEIGVSLNEFLAPRWQKVISQTTNIFYEN